MWSLSHWITSEVTFIFTEYFSPSPGQLSLVAMPTIKPGEAARICPIYYPHCLDLSQQDSQKILKHTNLISAFIQYKSLSSFSSHLTPPGSYLVPHSEWFDSPGSSTLTVLSLGDLDVSSLLVMPTDAKKIWIFLHFSWTLGSTFFSLSLFFVRGLFSLDLFSYISSFLEQY